MLAIENVIGKQEDWANYITNVEMLETPVLDWLRVGGKPVNPLYDYQVDKYRDPRENSHVDGKPWTNFGSGAENRGRLKALIQWLDEGVSVSKISQDVTNDAAIADQLAYEIPKKLKEMAQDWEAAICDDSDCREDNKVQGYKTRSIGEWVKATAQTLYPVPEAFRPPSASINTTAIASLVENDLRTVLQSQWNVCRNVEPVTGFVGLTLKNKITDFQYYLPATAATTHGGPSSLAFKDKTISRSVDYYRGDGYDVSLVLTPWLANLTGSATAKAGRGYFLHRSRWEMRWNQKPKVYRPEFKGGSYESAMDMIAMLVCTNPAAEAKLAPA
jgi:hypothetical protein